MSRVRSIALGFLVSLSAGYSVADTCWIETVSYFNTMPGDPSPIVLLEPMGIEVAVDESGDRYVRHDEGFRIQRLITAFVTPRMNEVWDRFPRFRGSPLKIASRYYCISDEAELLSRRARWTDPMSMRVTLSGDWTKALNAPATAAVSPARFYLRLTQPLYELDDKRVELNKSAPGSAEARKAGAEYAALQAAAMSKMNEFRLQLEKSSPDSKDARIAGIYYREMLLEASKIEWGTKPAISKDVVAAAEKEWQARVRENEDPMPSERLYRALAKVADATKQDKGNKLTDGSNRPVLTRVEAKQPSAEDIAAREKAQAVERKRKADEAAIVRAREAEDKKKSQAREEVLRASCMKPENRNNCECGRFYPGSSGGTCSR